MNFYSSSYPQEDRKKPVIHGLEDIKSMKDIAAFHESASSSDTKRASGGKMILSITARGNDMRAAKEAMGSAIDKIHFDGMYYGKDIINK